VRTMDWQPSKELIQWGNEHFGMLAKDSVWSPEDSGVQYRKMDDNKFALIFMLNHPLAQEHHEKFSLLMEACGYEVEKPDGLQMVTPPLNPIQQAEMQHEMRQKIAETWACECGFPLANCDLEQRVDEYVETIDADVGDGQTTPVDIWRCIIQCSACGTDLSIDPDDYHLLAGDSLFMSWTSSTHHYTALTRAQLKDFADAGLFTDGYSANITVLGEKVGDEKVPSWLWGISVISKELNDEEE